MATFLRKEFPLTLASEPRIRRAWLSCEKPLFLAQVNESGEGLVTAVQHGERFDLPQLHKVNAFAFRPISEEQTFQELAAAGPAGVQRYDLVSGIELMECRIDRATSVCYSSCGRLLAVGSADGLVKVFDLTGDCPEERYAEQATCTGISALSFSATADLLFVVNRKGELLAIDLKPISAPPQASQPLPGQAQSDQDEFTPAAEPVIVKAVPYLEQYGLELPDQDIYCVACHPKAHLLACAGDGPKLHLIKTDVFQMVTIDTNVGAAVKQIEFLDSLQQFVVVGTAGAEIWGQTVSGLRLQHRFKLAEGEKVLTVQKYGDTLFVVKQAKPVQPAK